jgi:hypothetical protein
MNMSVTDLAHFEDQLLGELREVVAARPAPSQSAQKRRYSRPLVLAGAAGAAALAAVAVLAGGGGTTTRAYAVEPLSNDLVVVSISSPTDATGLQSALETAGVPAVVDFDPADQALCVGTPPSSGDGPIRRSATGDEFGSVKAIEENGHPTWAELPPSKPWADPGAHSRLERHLGDFPNTVIRQGEGATFNINTSRIEPGERLFITTSDGTVGAIDLSVSSQEPPAGCGAL